MAERRMFAKTIVLSDAFLDMPMSARCLYFTLGMLGDDEGFINSPKSIMRQCGASEDDLKLLVAKKFIIPFESGVVVIKHWRIHNYIQSDRFHATKYITERDSLSLDENNSYTMDTKCIQDVSNMDTEVRLGKDRIGKASLGEDRIGEVIDNMSCNPVPYSEVIDYLNILCGTNYKANTKATQKHIKARFNEGFTLDDFKTVIAKKSREWKDDPKMSQYLRPETLFGTKFESYLNQQAKTSKAERWLNA